jgi:hypothetical protein
VQRIAARLSEARGKLFEREVMMLVDMRGVLNDPQWMKMRTFLDRMQDERGRPNGPNPQKQPRPNANRPRPQR